MRSLARTVAVIPVLVLAGCDGTREAPLPRPGVAVGWSHYGGDAGSRRFSPLTAITPENAGDLEPAWTWETHEKGKVATETGEKVWPGRFEATALAFRDTLFLSTPFNRVVALDGRSGWEIWSFDPGASDRGLISNDHAGFVHRGVASWEGTDGRRILIASRWELIALDASTGQPVASFGHDGRVDLAANLKWPVNRRHYGNTSPPLVWNDIVVVGSAVGDGIIHEKDPPGDVQAFDVRTGERLWTWDPIPAPGSDERSTWESGSADVTGHANVWAPMSVDVERGLLYLPVSAPSNDWYGGNRLGNNLFTQSIVCLDVRTGELVWYRQIVHHGLWDYDPPSAPVLVEMPRDEGSLDALLLAGKTGYLYVLDRVTGEPVWPFEELPAPESDVRGERTSPTQPHPVWPEPFAVQGFASDDVVDFTPEIRQRALELLEGRRLGPMFTPPSLEGTVVMPGWIGGAGWGSTSVDPERGLIFVKGSNRPVLAQLMPTGDDRLFRLDSTFATPERLKLALPRPKKWFLFDQSPVEIPINKPPYGTLTAYDLETGQRRWHVPLGDTPEIRDHAEIEPLDLPRLGVFGAPGGVATAGGVIFISGGGNVLFAVESETGDVLGSYGLGRDGYSVPMTYRATDGRQYVAVATGDGEVARLQAFVLDVN